MIDMNVYTVKASIVNNITNMFGICRACERGDVETVKKIINTYGKHVNNICDDMGMNLLHTASMYGGGHDYYEILNLLLKNGINVNKKNISGETPLLRACSFGDDSHVELFIKHGANINEKDYCNESPLHVTMMTKNYKCMKILLEHGADVNIVNAYNETPLHYAHICPQRSEPHICSDDEYVNSYRDAVGMLLKYGADVNIVNAHNETPLHYLYNNFFAKYIAKNLTCVNENAKMLIDYGANVNIKNIYGETPLHIACRVHKNNKIFEFLLTHGANIIAKNNNRETPEIILQQHKQNDAICFFKKEINKRIYILSLVMNHDVLKHHIVKRMN